MAKTGRQKEFEVALQKLRGRDADISDEAAEIQEYITTLDRFPQAKLLDLFQSRYLRSVIVVVTGLGAAVMDKAGRKPLILVNYSTVLILENFMKQIPIHTRTFLLYAVINVLAVLFVIAVVPETKGKTLEQIQGEINN
ncbi:hypothetical protein DVH24_002770 [Malus domestica]|uniref:Major facilitator superfamily (MFS) profile domain-containing protein n=1 Tax=Malus domestica TaxID=3750 RepID=A0A498KB49_MALDO|nr:hypothetical protein DVH24_002770 [Malus domestica]